MFRGNANGGKITGLALTRRLAVVVAVCLAIRCASELGERRITLPDWFAVAALALKLPVCESESPDISTLVLALELPGAMSSAAVDPSEPVNDNISEPETGDEPIEPPQEYIEDTPAASEPKNTTITGDSAGYEGLADGIYIQNRTGYDIDVEALLREPLTFSASTGAEVLIIHTHGSEAYTMSGEDVYEESDPYRTEDPTQNVIRVGDELERILTAHGITVIHDRETYDYPSYNGSYTRAWESITEYLAANENIKVVIDLHRDALVGDDGTVYKTVADVGDLPCAQVMLISGSDYSGLNHPEWRKNLSFALKLQAEMVKNYPTLARPLSISEYRYNQNATTGSLIVEVGTNGNTLQEALTAVGYFGECLAEVLNG